jgi:hypothetical protein
MDAESKILFELEFPVIASLKVDAAQLDAINYDLQSPDELKEAILEWVIENACPGVYYSDYSGKNSLVCIRDQECTYETGSDFSDDFKITLIED